MFSGEQPPHTLEIPFDAPAPTPSAPATDWRAQVPSVSQLTRRIRGHIEGAFLDTWVKGEISNFKRAASGHAYFILKDATAQLKSVMFRPALSKIKFQIQDGQEILLHGKVTVYEARGEYQMVADHAEPVGVGALQLAFEQLKKKLSAEGLFEAGRKKKLPPLPRRLGIVTSATGAAVRDILKVLDRRFPNLDIVIFPTTVQGEKAAPEIVQALLAAERWNEERPERRLDLLIVGRGGGSLEDLWPFNEEIVARAIARCPIPTVSAVGHEIDFTIADFVADVRAPTPSAAAEMAVPAKADLIEAVDQRMARLNLLVQRRLEQLRLHLTHLGNRLVDPRERARALKESCQLLAGKLALAMQNRLRLARHRLEAGATLLHSLSPLRVLSRGYALTRREDGKLVQSVADVSSGTRITTRLADGTLVSEVLSATPEPL